MIIGIGTDIVRVGRIRAAAENRRFFEEYFGARERAMINNRTDAAKCAANNFAAKEAFAKALGTGVRGFSLKEIEILRDDLGRPYISLSGAANDAAVRAGVKNIHVTLSDTEENSVAFVVLEG